MKNREQNSRKSLLYFLFFIALIVGPVLTICKIQTRDRESNSPEKNEPIDIDKLRSLPYVTGVDTQPGEKSGVTLYDENNSYPGHNLYTIGPLSTTKLIDMEGNLINSWSFSPSERWSHAELLSNGDLLVVGALPLSEKEKEYQYTNHVKNRYLLRFDWKGRLLWKKTLLTHHDVELSPDGKIFVLCLNYRIIPKIHPEKVVPDTMFVRLDKDGNVIESKSLYDLVKDSNVIFPLQKGKAQENVIDLFHTNSIEQMHYEHLAEKHPIYNLENILVCVRHQDRIVIINWPENKIVWAWGQNIVSGPHHASLLENGHILLFDNGLGREGSRVIELDPITKKIVWQYQDETPSDFCTLSRGSAQRLPNGNTLIAESDRGRAFEITPEGKKVWEFLCPHVTEKGKRGIITRIERYTVQFIDGTVKVHNLVGTEKVGQK